LNAHVFNFENSFDLLQELKKHRAALSLQDEIVLKQREIATKIEGVKHLREKLVPIEDEIAKIHSYLERGIYDRFAFRSEIEPVQSRFADLMKRIQGLEKDIENAEWQIRRYTREMKPSQDFLEEFEKTVHIYSQVTINHNDEEKTYLVVPDIVKQKKMSPGIDMLARESELGKVLINQPLGILKTNDRKFQNLIIESTNIASNLILREVHLDEGDFGGHRRDIIKDRRYGGSEQRWQDAARDDYYIKCSKCGGLYPIGSTCDC
jgi:hypothetical protein